MVRQRQSKTIAAWRPVRRNGAENRKERRVKRKGASEGWARVKPFVAALE